jgi:hypothetical protein
VTLEELARALVKATGPDRAIDLELEKMRRGLMAYQNFPPRYTSSLDAAAELLAADIDQQEIRKSQFDWTVEWVRGRAIVAHVLASTEPLARCLARVKYERNTK